MYRTEKIDCICKAPGVTQRKSHRVSPRSLHSFLRAKMDERGPVEKVFLPDTIP